MGAVDYGFIISKNSYLSNCSHLAYNSLAALLWHSTDILKIFYTNNRRTDRPGGSNVTDWMFVCDPMAFSEFDDFGMVGGDFEWRDKIIGTNGHRCWKFC